MVALALEFGDTDCLLATVSTTSIRTHTLLFLFSYRLQISTGTIFSGMFARVGEHHEGSRHNRLRGWT